MMNRFTLFLPSVVPRLCLHISSSTPFSSTVFHSTKKYFKRKKKKTYFLYNFKYLFFSKQSNDKNKRSEKNLPSSTVGWNGCYLKITYHFTKSSETCIFFLLFCELYSSEKEALYLAFKICLFICMICFFSYFFFFFFFLLMKFFSRTSTVLFSFGLFSWAINVFWMALFLDLGKRGERVGKKNVLHLN